MCTCSREVTETGYIQGGDEIEEVKITDSDANAACQALCCQTPDCAGGDVEDDVCILYKNTEGNNVGIGSSVPESSESSDSSVLGHFAFLC